MSLSGFVSLQMGVNIHSFPDAGFSQSNWSVIDEVFLTRTTEGLAIWSGCFFTSGFKLTARHTWLSKIRVI